MSDAEIIKRNQDTDKVFEKIKGICEDYLGQHYPAAPDPDHYTGRIKDLLRDYSKIWEEYQEPQKEPQIIIVVESGVIQVVHSNTPIKYRLIDIDNIKTTEENPTDALGTFLHLKQDSLFTDIEEKTKEILTEV